MSGLFDLNKMLMTVHNFGTGPTEESFIRLTYDSTYYSEQTANFDDVLYVASCMNFLDLNGDKISLLQNGYDFIDLTSKYDNHVMLDSNDLQKKFVFDCLDTACINDMCKTLFEKFYINYSFEPPTWNAYLRLFDNKERFLLDILCDIGVVSFERKMVWLDNQHLNLFSVMKHGLIVNWSELFERKQQVGNLGEDLSMNYEVKRLTNYCRGDLADMIKQTSLIDPYAGYDIMSFDAPDSDEDCPDRFIEVKATVGTRPNFFWSKNEIIKAKQYGTKYWIYLWVNVDNDSRKLYLIQDPYKNLFETGNPIPEPTTYLIDGNVLEHANMEAVETI